MTRCIATIAILAALLLSGLLPSAVGAETTLLLPDTMAAVGDSITQAASTGGTLGADAPQNSWSTGTSATVNSHYLRLLALGSILLSPVLSLANDTPPPPPPPSMAPARAAACSIRSAAWPASLNGSISPPNSRPRSFLCSKPKPTRSRR